MRLFEIMIPDNVSLEATGDAARLAIKRAGARGGNSWQVGLPRRLSSRLLAGIAFGDAHGYRWIQTKPGSSHQPEGRGIDMTVIERLPRYVWRLFRYLPPRLAYSLGLGSITGRAVLLLTTVGRRSGLPRVTPLLYDEIDRIVYVGSARGAKADWYQNLQANPNVEVTVGSRRFRGCADLITDPLHVADFVEKRLKLHPILTAAVMRVEGLGSTPSREQLEQYAKRRTLVAIRPDDEA